MTFVDTGSFYALTIPSDICHEQAVAWLRSSEHQLVTTDFVVYELVTLLRRRGHNAHALHVGSALFEGTLASVEWVTRADVDAAWAVFRDFADKAWSFTDCVSRVVMERLGITQAFAFDEHFRQFGTVAVVP